MNILLITKSFYPAQGSRALQTTKLAQSLNNENFKLYVISEFMLDGNRYALGKMPDLNISNGKIKPIKKIHFIFQHFSNTITRIKNVINSSFNFGKWMRNAKKLGERIVKDKNIDVIFSISLPFESNMVGLKLKEKYPQIPWITFYSDPWPILPEPYNKFSIPIISTLQKKLLKSAFINADRIIMPSKYQAEFMQEVFSYNLSEKLRIIPNFGSKSNKCEKLKYEKYLIHIGHYTRHRVSKALFYAAIDAKKHFSKNFKGILFVGHVCEELIDAIKDLNIEDVFHFRGTVDYETANDIAVNAGALLVVEADMPKSTFLPSKFADYATTCRPIIAITPPVSAIRDLSKKSERCITVLNDKVQIYNALEKLFKNSTYPNIENDVINKSFAPENIIDMYKNVFKDFEK